MGTGRPCDTAAATQLAIPHRGSLSRRVSPALKAGERSSPDSCLHEHISGFHWAVVSYTPGNRGSAGALSACPQKDAWDPKYHVNNLLQAANCPLTRSWLFTNAMRAGDTRECSAQKHGCLGPYRETSLDWKGKCDLKFSPHP